MHAGLMRDRNQIDWATHPVNDNSIDSVGEMQTFTKSPDTPLYAPFSTLGPLPNICWSSKSSVTPWPMVFKRPHSSTSAR